MAQFIARKAATIVLRETRGFSFNKINVRFDAPAGRSGKHYRKLLPIFSFQSTGDIVGVRAFGGLWEVEVRVVILRGPDGRLARGSDGKTMKGVFIYHAKHVAWLDEAKLTTNAQMRDALAKVAHKRHYDAALRKFEAAHGLAA